MGPINGPAFVVLFLALLQYVCSNGDKFEPMVAFMCNKPAMHKVVDGWVADEHTDCLSDKKAILKYCKELYPNHDITNIVETSYWVNIPGWPSKNGRKHTHRSRPFRCIVGQFQSDALLVPQHCEFDHHHDTDMCRDFDFWNQTAISMCRDRKMATQSFAMLLECKIDMFNGVEFVCCPKEKRTGPPHKLHVHEEGGDAKTDHHRVDKPFGASKHSDNVYDVYLHGHIPGQFQNEHAFYEAARTSMRKEQQAKNTKLMKEWTAAREHVAELKKTDPKSAIKLSNEITERFQRLYQAYEQEDDAEKQQIVALHQQHVQRNLNEHKRKTMEKYMNALQRKDAHKILKYLLAYLRTEEKDRMHTINHFEHVKYTHPDEATRIQPHIIQHLHLIDQRINQSLQMLSRLPDLEKTIRPKIEKFLTKYKAIDATIKDVLLVATKPDSSADNSVDSSSSNEAADVTTNHIDRTESVEREPVSVETEDPETVEDEHAYEHDDQFFAHQQDHSMNIQQGMTNVKSISVQSIHGAAVGSTFAIAIGSISVFVIIIVAVVMLRRRSSRQTVTHGYVEVDPSASPEERHVANMQMNGYENPTYKYFEVAPTQQ